MTDDNYDDYNNYSKVCNHSLAFTTFTQYTSTIPSTVEKD